MVYKSPEDSGGVSPGSDLDKASQETLNDLVADLRTPGVLLDSVVKSHRQNESLMEQLALHPNVMPQTLFYLFTNASTEFKKRLQQLKIKKDSSEEFSKGLVPVQDQSLAHRQSDTDKQKQKKPPIKEENLYQRVQKMTMAEKVRFVSRAGKEARALLLKDPSPQISMAVLNSPKITEGEILMIAQSRNVTDAMLREVGKNKNWLKNYQIVFALVENPKTPLPISMPLLNKMKAKDLGLLSKSRNIPEAIRSGASRLVMQKQKQT